MPPAENRPGETSLVRLVAALGGSVLSMAGLALFLQTILETPILAETFFSDIVWRGVLGSAGVPRPLFEDRPPASVPLVACLGLAAFTMAAAALVAAFLLRGRTGIAKRFASTWRGQTVAWSPAGLWWLAWIVAAAGNGETALTLLAGVVDLTLAACLAMSLLFAVPWREPGSASGGTTAASNSRARRGPQSALLAGMATYIVVFTAMNAGLWFNLRIPHGDSAMYEEHLWNLEHGKGFRSYLDQGLFLGEHLQVIHLLLMPLHLLFPSHLTLEIAQTVILALGAWPVYRLARRHSGSEGAAALLGLAYLANYPLQFLDISIDVKTFRPNSLAIPTLLAALDCLELRRYRLGAFWLLLTLSAQEDYAIPIALIGAWLTLTNRPLWPNDASGRRRAAWGLFLFASGVIYLWLAVTVIIPWFRGGARVHTASYFSRFGSSPREILTTLLTRPDLVFATLFNAGSLLYGLRLLFPVAFLPLLSPGRLAVAAPLFLLLCMNDLAMQTPAPVHHFHAAIIPLLFWAAAAGLRTSGLSAAALCETKGNGENQAPAKLRN